MMSPGVRKLALTVHLTCSVGWIGAVLACGPKVIALQKRLILDWERLAPADAVNTGIEAFVEAWQTPEPKLAMDSFLAAKAARKRTKKSGA